MAENNQLARFENAQIIEIINKIANLTEKDKHDLTKRIANDDIEIRKIALEKINKSLHAQNDLNMLVDFQAALNKQGLYMTSKQSIETASGKFEIQLKGGDSKLIIRVLIIAAIVIISSLLILFWH